jgi:hypothetical protein
MTSQILTPEAHPGRKKVVVLACARSATLYMSKLLKEVGIDARHEKMGADGTVSSYFVPRSDDMPLKPESALIGMRYHMDGSRAPMYRFDEVFHQIRNPLKMIRSGAYVITKVDRAWNEKYISRYDKNYAPSLMKPLVRTMTYWLYWNRLVDDLWKPTFRYRIEDIDAAWPEIARRVDRPGAPLPDVSRTTHTNVHKLMSHKPITWKNLEDVDPVLTERVREKAMEYGYPLAELVDQ